MADGCIFCKIVNGELDAVKVWEDDEFLAILDLFPTTKGKTLVLTKKHYDSDLFRMPEDAYTRLLLASRKVAKYLERGLDADRIAVIVEGLEVNHVHIKLNPLYGGLLSTKSGPKAETDELERIAREIKRKNAL
ncbi:HIT domain protein [uncultured archaeon]|nr:HIT domain protein [uncultured archaeon]